MKIATAFLPPSVKGRLYADNSQGFSILELLIASVISSLLLFGLSRLNIDSLALNRASFKSSQLHNDGYFALQLLSSASAQSGAILDDPIEDESLYQFFYRGRCGDHSICTYQDTHSSQIAIIAPASINRDCTDQSRNIGENDNIANVYWLADNQHGSRSLYCRGYNISTDEWVENGSSLPLVDNIESFNVDFLITATVAGEQRFSYQLPQQIVDWNQIVGVRINLSTEDHHWVQTVAIINNTEVFR